LHLVGRLFVSEVEEDDAIKYERRLRVGTHAMYTTKARSVPGRELPAIIREPNLAQILGYMLGKEVAKPEGVSEKMMEFAPMVVPSQ
jgi:hypothetical protein